MLGRMEDAVEVCTPNIGPRERRTRQRFGLLTLAVGVAIGGGLIALGLARWWRLGLLLPLAMGALGVFQAREKT